MPIKPMQRLQPLLRNHQRQEIPPRSGGMLITDKSPLDHRLRIQGWEIITHILEEHHRPTHHTLKGNRDSSSKDTIQEDIHSNSSRIIRTCNTEWGDHLAWAVDTEEECLDTEVMEDRTTE